MKRSTAILVLLLVAGLPISPLRAASTPGGPDELAQRKALVNDTVFYSVLTINAEREQASARLKEERKKIEALREQVATGAKALVQLVAAQERYLAELAARDRMYAAAIAVFRKAVQDIAATDEGEAALRQYNAGDERGALAKLDEIIAAHDAARAVRVNLEKAAERRRVATLALDARNRGKVETSAVIARFEEVTRLDPGVFWDWIELSRLYQDAGQLPAALKAAKAGGDAASGDSDRYVALGEAIEIATAQGNLPEAHKMAKEVYGILVRLADADKSSASLQRDVSVSLEKLGSVLVAQGDLPAARARFQDSLDIRRRLADADKSSASFQRDVSGSLDRLGDVLVAQAGYRWIRFEDAKGRSRALRSRDGKTVAFPVTAISRILDMNHKPDVAGIYAELAAMGGAKLTSPVRHLRFVDDDKTCGRRFPRNFSISMTTIGFPSAGGVKKKSNAREACRPARAFSR